MTESLVNILYSWGLSKESIIFIVSALPVSELRGAIPLGVLAMKEPFFKTYIIAVLGNMVPVALLLLWLEPVSNKLRKVKLWAKFFDWLFERTRRKAKVVERFEALGLILFVCIPLPVTGAWTGCVAATLFKIRFKLAFWAIGVGVMLAGLIVSTLVALGKCFV